jgi:four helix bundle protein
VGDYRKLDVWKRAKTLATRVRSLEKGLPPDERADIGEQIRRSSQSIRFNIAEGCGFNSDPQLARCLLISLAEANELQDQLDALDERGLLPPEDQDLKTETAGVRAMIVGFHRTVTAKKPSAKRRPRR